MGFVNVALLGKSILAGTVNIRTWRWSHPRWGGGGPKSNNKCQEKRKGKDHPEVKMEAETERTHL